MPNVDYLGEGASDLVVARKLIELTGGVVGNSYYRPARGAGKDKLDQRLNGLNAGAAFGRLVLVLRDLDGDAECAAALVAQLLPTRHENLLLRVAVRSAEAWYMADAEAYAQFCGMSARVLPRRPEELPSIKQSLIDWVGEGTARNLKRHLEEGRNRGVPDWASLGRWHAIFAERHWSPDRAIESGRAPSLERAVERLRACVEAVGK